MTRFTRARGSKASNERVPEDATSWKDMKNQLETSKDAIDNEQKRKQVEAKQTPNKKARGTPAKNTPFKNTPKQSPGQKNTPKQSPGQKNTPKQSPGAKNTPAAVKNTPKQVQGVKNTPKQTPVKSPNPNKASVAKGTPNNSNGAKKSPKKQIAVKKEVEEEEEDDDVSDDEVGDLELSDEASDDESEVGDANDEGEVGDLKEQDEDSDDDDYNEASNDDQDAEASDDEENDENDESDDGDEASDDEKPEEKPATVGTKRPAAGNGPQAAKKSKKVPKNVIERSFNSTKAIILNEDGTEESDQKSKSTRDNPPRKTLVCNGRAITVQRFHSVFLRPEDCDKLYALKADLQAKGTSRKEIDKVITLHRRRFEKVLRRMKQLKCFNCGKNGHPLSKCKDLKSKEALVEKWNTGLCFRCGSTEHPLSECKGTGTELGFAVCFVCHEKGHIAKFCPKNSKGIYRHGGSCRICNEVSHLARDCPVKKEVETKKEAGVGVIDGGNPDKLDGADGKNKGAKVVKRNKPQQKKVVKI